LGGAGQEYTRDKSYIQEVIEKIKYQLEVKINRIRKERRCRNGEEVCSDPMGARPDYGDAR
jgi:hypothetical protein